MKDANKLIRQYIAFRDKLESLEAAHKQKIADLKSKMESIEVELLEDLDSANIQNIKTASGTAYINTSISVSVADRLEFLDYVFQNDRRDMIDARCNKTAAKEYFDEHGDYPPGTNVVKIRKVMFRKG